MQLIIIGLLILFVCHAHSQNTLQSVYTYFGEDKVISCFNNTIMEKPTWILPEGKAMDPQKYEEYNQSLKIKDINENDRGIYACTFKNEAAYDIYLLNMAGPLFKNKAEKYKTQFLIGGIACIFVLAICISVFLVNRFEYKDLSTDERSGEINKSFEDSEDTQF
ncbi:hypothetical protein Ahia01_001012500 [Argonauta hians]